GCISTRTTHGCAEIWSPLQWEIPSSMARRSSGRIVHKTESWVTRAAQRRSWGSAHSTCRSISRRGRFAVSYRPHDSTPISTPSPAPISARRALGWGLDSLPRIARGEGSYLYDTTGRRYLDGSRGPAAFGIGHDNPEVNATIASQRRS